MSIYILLKITTLSIIGTLSSVQSEPRSSPELWRGLHFGMSGEQASIALRKIPGVVNVAVQTDKHGRTTVQVKTDRNFTVAEQRARIVPEFIGNQLSSMSLIITGNSLLTPACQDEIAELHYMIDQVLTQKYEKISESNISSKFTNDTVGVVVAQELKPPTGDFDYAGNACARRGISQSGVLRIRYVHLDSVKGSQNQNTDRIEKVLEGL